MKKSNILLYVLAGVLGALVLAFFVVMGSDSFACVVQKWFGTENKKRTLQFLGWIISGFITFFGLLILGRWVAAQEKGLIQDRFKAAVEVVVKKLDFLLFLFVGVSISAFIGVIVSESFACVVQKWFGTEGKKDTLQFLIGIIGGVAGLYGLFALGRRVAAQEKGLVQDRFKAAIDHLSNENSEISRIASFYEFFYLARDNKDDYAQTILDVLCTYLRQITQYEDYSHLHFSYNHPEEVKFLARMLFGKETGKVFDGLHFDLKHSNLTGIDFQGIGNPKEIDFSSADLNYAIFNGANLSGADFYNATLLESKFVKTNLQGADLRKAELQNADLREAKNLLTANLREARHNKGENDKGTKFPDGFKPEDYGMEYCPLDDDDDEK